MRHSTYVEATPEQVFEVLLDATTYPRWVVGTREVESVDPSWPAPGSWFRVVFAGGRKKEQTDLLELEVPKRIVLDAHVPPLGDAISVIEVEARDGGSLVSIDETLQSPPDLRPLEWAASLAIYLRNIEGFRRFRRLVTEWTSAD